MTRTGGQYNQKESVQVEKRWNNGNTNDEDRVNSVPFEESEVPGPVSAKVSPGRDS